MAERRGTADLPLHGGRAPRWLFERMSALAPAIVEAIVVDRGPAAVLERLSDPFWFQAFGCVLGFDWHSSGVTTTVCGALKQGLAGREADTGLIVAGGKGRASRRTPDELRDHAARFGLDGDALVHNSRTLRVRAPAPPASRANRPTSSSASCSVRSCCACRGGTPSTSPATSGRATCARCWSRRTRRRRPISRPCSAFRAWARRRSARSR